MQYENGSLGLCSAALGSRGFSLLESWDRNYGPSRPQPSATRDFCPCSPRARNICYPENCSASAEKSLSAVETCKLHRALRFVLCFFFFASSTDSTKRSFPSLSSVASKHPQTPYVQNTHVIWKRQRLKKFLCNYYCGLVNPFTPKFKKYILPAFYKGNV